MAKIKYTPGFLGPILNYVPTSGVEDGVSLLKKAERLKIFYDRNFRGFEKEDIRASGVGYESETPGRLSIKQRNEFQQNNVTSVTGAKEFITITDIDYNENEEKDTRHYKSLNLPFVPRELNYNPESNFVGIASFGRNNPYYQFTGSEDTLTFDIDWLSEDNAREDVIFNCRWIEALTKGDGYEQTPHRVNLVWGNGNRLWEGVVWLVVAAPYKMTEFVRGYRDPKTKQFQTSNMMPNRAIQSVTLKRLIDYNLSSNEIINGTLPERILTPRFF